MEHANDEGNMNPSQLSQTQASKMALEYTGRIREIIAQAMPGKAMKSVPDRDPKTAEFINEMVAALKDNDQC